MYVGQTLFAQLMDFVPWTTFARLVGRHCGDHRVRTLTCAEQYRAMAFAQLTYRESLRDIETCLSAQAAKLYHMGFREPVRRSALADANETRDGRIYAALAQTLIVQARKLYAGEDLGLDLKNTVYALDSTTIDLCDPTVAAALASSFTPPSRWGAGVGASIPRMKAGRSRAGSAGDGARGVLRSAQTFPSRRHREASDRMG